MWNRADGGRADRRTASPSRPPVAGRGGDGPRGRTLRLRQTRGPLPCLLSCLPPCAGCRGGSCGEGVACPGCRGWRGSPRSHRGPPGCGVVCGRPAVRGVRGRPGTRKVGTAGRIRSFFTFRTPRRRRASTRCNGGGPWRAQSGADCTSPTCDVHVTAATVSPRKKTGRYPCVAKMARHGHIRIRGTGLPRAAGYDRCRRSGRPGGPGTRRHRRSAGDQEGHGPAGVPP